MTLDTNLRVTGDIDHKELFHIAIKAILNAAGRDDDIDSVSSSFQGAGHIPQFILDSPNVDDEMKGEWRETSDVWQTSIGQGLPGIVTVTDNHDHYEVSYDTGYAYSVGGLNCTTLHLSAMLFLEQSLPEGSRITEWENEYTGDWNDAENGIGPGVPEFIGGGDDALEWFSEVSTHIMFGVK